MARTAAASLTRSAAPGSPPAAGRERTVMVSMPRSPICSRASRRAPSPTDETAVTAATPKTTPVTDSVERSLWTVRLRTARRTREPARGERAGLSGITRPSRSRTRRAARPASASLWVTSTSVRPSRLSSKSSAAISSPVVVSRLPVGSSARRTRRGSRTRARAMAARCASPPESSDGRCDSRWARPTRSRPRRARSRHSSAGTPAYSSGVSTFSATVSWGIRWKDWKTKPMLRLRTRDSSTSSRLATGIPSSR